MPWAVDSEGREECGENVEGPEWRGGTREVEKGRWTTETSQRQDETAGRPWWVLRNTRCGTVYGWTLIPDTTAS